MAEAAAGLYAAESAVEGAAVAAYSIAKPTFPLRARFSKIESQPLPRSSHTLSIIKGQAFIFGGEVTARQPVDNAVHIYTLPSSGVKEADYRCTESQGEEAPPARVGHTAAVVAHRLFIFGGRGGKDMKPLEEAGRVWEFDTMSLQWSILDPRRGTPFPEARSYHSSTSSPHPLPTKQPADSKPYDPNTLTGAEPDLSYHGTIIIHGGCPASGRTADVWAFDIGARVWTQLPDAPAPARGGPALTIARDRLYRYGGFDGDHELGGQIDYLELAKQTSDDKGGHGELGIFPRSGVWKTVHFEQGQGPGNRSVAGLHSITTGQGRNYLVLLLGEREPSADGHNAAGQFWNDVWAYQVRPDGMTAASIKDATRQLFGAKISEGTWAQVEIAEATKSDGLQAGPGARGWFSSAGWDDAEGSIVIWGGINGSNERLSDGWILDFNPDDGA